MKEASPEHTRNLRNAEIFSELSTATLAAIEQSCSWQKYEPGEGIIDYLDTSDSVFFLVSGEARVTIYSASGKTVSFDQISAGEVFGEYPAIVGGSRSASVEACTPCIVASMSSSSFKNLLTKQPTVTFALLIKFVSKIRSLTARVYEFSALAANNRIQAEILRLANCTAQSGECVTISRAPTHSEIASRVSSHREAVTRELNRLARLGIIERRGENLTVKDMDRLTEMVRNATGE